MWLPHIVSFSIPQEVPSTELRYNRTTILRPTKKKENRKIWRTILSKCKNSLLSTPTVEVNNECVNNSAMFVPFHIKECTVFVVTVTQVNVVLLLKSRSCAAKGINHVVRFFFAAMLYTRLCTELSKL